MRDIVILSTQYWRDSWFRKHQFAVRFVRDGHTVWYVEPTHSLARSAHIAGVGSNPMATTWVWETGDGPTALTPARVLPFPRVPAIGGVNQWVTLSRVRRALSRAGANDALFIAYDARFSRALGPELAEGRVVFEMVDDLTGYAATPKLQQRAFEDVSGLCDAASRVAYTSANLAEKFPAAHDSAVIPNGFDDRLFNPAVAPKSAVPRGRKTIGFVGTLFSFLDYGLLLQVADAFKDASLVLVGRLEVSDSAVAQLLGRENVIHLGYVDRGDVPSIVAGFDVCLAPFQTGAVSDAVSPLKLYEYLAMLKPVVCTSMTGLMADPVAQYVEFANDGDEFVQLIAEALAGRSAQPEGLWEFIQDYSWDALYGRFRSLLGEELLA